MSLKIFPLLLVLSSGPVLAQIAVSPQSYITITNDPVLFGDVAIGDTALRSTRITLSASGEPADITVAVYGSGFFLGPGDGAFHLNNNGSRGINIFFAPSDTGSRTGTGTVDCGGGCFGNLFGLIGRGSPSAAVPGAPDEDVTPTAALHPVYPNPSKGTVAVPFEIPARGHLLLALVASNGAVVKTLKEGLAEPGSYQVFFDTGELAAGTYRCQLYTGHEALSVPLVIVR